MDIETFYNGRGLEFKKMMSNFIAHAIPNYFHENFKLMLGFFIV
jgi:hypothetical protein